ncbi:MAG: FKBP-type peptidyl-prolyl cis-trans isomerase [Acinetobacter populi]|jgi:FKBP-type peptidyl-prolyl cis-trans isomerase FkpA/FKBP-type peptidyl-prolyl cis-trans isomerase FklB|uniref:FKBP-type peptidyl-prolyl cis-trans isomerase n=1 Tax=Acinetobacter populi TaxID=1582270 RepID=UPI002353F5DE|nr:FKBP-type peptidyl-prolyl cis-trans isomerase [Acinetobacter populi]MCH4248717.1 FKBP-type peptidyl-prolyl cis-trans isomerase [Acinetobacter populi]
MSKALPIVVAAVLGSVALVPVYFASQNPTKYQASSHHSSFDPKTATAVEKISYVFGYEVTSQMTPPELDVNAFSAGARAGHAHEEFPYSKEEINAAYQEFVAQQKNNDQPAALSQPEVSAPSDDANVKFLTENAKKPNVKTTASGLQYIVDKEGTGKQPKATDVVKVNYEGKLITGEVFDSSFENGQPVEFPLNQVIPGWTEGLQLMKEGAEYTFFIPAKLGYGAQGTGPIPANSTLIFKVQLLEVK